MNVEEGIVLVGIISLVDPFARKRDANDLAAAGEVFAKILPTAPLDWAEGFVREQLSRGHVPSVPDIATAWKEEARRRVGAVPVPTAPAEIEDDPVRWQQWERQRRSALIQGATETQAITHADRQLGVSRQRAQITSGHSPEKVRSAKEDVRAQLREWEERQRRHQFEAEEDNRGGEAR